MTRILNLATMVLSLAVIPLASGTVEEWSGRTLGVDYTITGGVDVTILVNGTFKFQAEDGSGNLDVIGDINVADGVTGTVIVYIERDTDNDSPGATNVDSIDLTNNQGAGLTGNLAEVRITGNLATAGDVICAAIIGEVDVGGTFGDGPGSTTYLLHAGTGSGNITIAGDCPGDLDLGTYSSGNITIGGLLTGDLDAGNPHDVTLAGAGEHTGDISFNSDSVYAYDLDIGDPNNADPQNPNIMSGDIYIRYGTQGHGGDTGYIRVYGDMYGSIQIGDSGHAGGDFTYGTIVIEKSLYNDITIVGPLGTSGYVVRPAMIQVYENFSARREVLARSRQSPSVARSSAGHGERSRMITGRH